MRPRTIIAGTAAAITRLLFPGFIVLLLFALVRGEEQTA